MYEKNELIKAAPVCVYDITQMGKRVQKFRVDYLDPVTKKAVDKSFFFQPTLKELGIEDVALIRPKYHNLFQASFKTAIWCEGEKSADAMNNALNGRLDYTGKQFQ